MRSQTDGRGVVARPAGGSLTAIAEAEAARLGAVRLTDLTGLDRFGAPCWQVTRPGARDVPGNVSVTTGKGWTPEQARLGALMESIERHWAENPAPPYEIATAEDVARRGERFVPPASVPLPEGVADPGNRPMAWFRGATLAGTPVWVPAHEVAAPFECPPGAHNPPVWRSTGLAAGTTVEDAALRGLLEVIERDAVAAAQLTHTGASIDPGDLESERVREVVRLAKALDMEVEFKLLSAAGGVHAAAAVLGNPWENGLARLVCGHSAHPDFTTAVEGALLEALQSRASFIAGAREDLERFGEIAAVGYAEARERLHWWCTRTTPVEVPASAGSSDIREIAATLGKQGFGPVVWVRLSPRHSPVVVVKVVVPGASDVCEAGWRIGRRFTRADQRR